MGDAMEGNGIFGFFILVFYFSFFLSNFMPFFCNKRTKENMRSGENRKMGGIGKR